MIAGTLVSPAWKGLLCREESCLQRVVLVHTPKDKRMPLEVEPVTWKPGDDERGLFVVVRPWGFAAPPVALSLKAARDQGFDVDEKTPIFRAHWSGCTNAGRFRAAA